MKMTLTLAIVLAIMAGCATMPTPEPRPIDRAKIINALNMGQTVFGASLSWAEIRGADIHKTAQIRVIGNAAFSLARNAVGTTVDGTDKDDLLVALASIRMAVDDALTICEAVGVEPSTVEVLRVQIGQALDVVQAVLDNLPDAEG